MRIATLLTKRRTSIPRSDCVDIIYRNATGHNGMTLI